MEGFIDRKDVTSDAVLKVVRLWESGCGARPMMPRAHLRPGALGELLPWIFLVEFEFEPFRIRYRIVGSQQARLAGGDFSGRYLDETQHSAEVQAFTMELYRRMIATAAPVFATAGFAAMDGREHRYECGAVPLGDETGTRVTHALGIEDLRFIEPGNVIDGDPGYEARARERARRRPVRWAGRS